MLNIAVLDDEDMYIDRVCKITEKCMKQMEMDYEICIYKSGREVLEELKNDRYFDVYLLDMKLPDMDGLEVAKQIRRRFSEPILIYISHYLEYCPKVFELKTHRYIMKTTLEEDLPEAYQTMLEVFQERKRRDNRYYMAANYSGLEKIFYRDIYFLRKNKKYVDIVHKDGVTSVRMSLGAMLEELNGEEFLMIERSYIVNMDHVKSLKDSELLITNKETLPVSRPKLSYVKDVIMNRRG